MRIFSPLVYGSLLSIMMASSGFSQTVPACGEIHGPESVVSSPALDSTDNSITYDATLSRSGAPYGSICNSAHLNTGFEFTNIGGNAIIPAIVPTVNDENFSPSRDFRFVYKDRARQNMGMEIVDHPTNFSSQGMYSELFFFPRVVLPAILYPESNSSETSYKVVLPNREEVIFDRATNTIVGGVLKEDGPIDLGPDRFTRKFANISYHGSGLYFRVDKRGGEARGAGVIASIHQGTRVCHVSTAKLFNQAEGGGLVFLFPTDEAFNVFLQTQCQMHF
jgi:hypothetical protein